MAFTVEDGTGVVDANSYAAVADADAYFLERGVTGWAGTDDQKETWLIQATDYIEMRFGRRFLGEKEFPDTPQGLSFPRTGIEDVDGNEIEGIPLCLMRATYEYANRARVAVLAPDPVFETNGRLLVGKRTKVGPIETDLKYAQSGAGSSAPTFRPYPAADALLRPLLAAVGGTYR
jgi:hypothetical protein